MVSGLVMEIEHHISTHNTVLCTHVMIDVLLTTMGANTQAIGS